MSLCKLGPVVLITPLEERIVYPHIFRVTYALTFRVLHDFSLILSPLALKQAVLTYCKLRGPLWWQGAGAAAGRLEPMGPTPTCPSSEDSKHRALHSRGPH